jgi:hypothetical protein
LIYNNPFSFLLRIFNPKSHYLSFSTFSLSLIIVKLCAKKLLLNLGVIIIVTSNYICRYNHAYT